MNKKILFGLVLLSIFAGAVAFTPVKEMFLLVHNTIVPQYNIDSAYDIRASQIIGHKRVISLETCYPDENNCTDTTNLIDLGNNITLENGELRLHKNLFSNYNISTQHLGSNAIDTHRVYTDTIRADELCDRDTGKCIKVIDIIQNCSTPKQQLK